MLIGIELGLRHSLLKKIEADHPEIFSGAA